MVSVGGGVMVLVLVCVVIDVGGGWCVRYMSVWVFGTVAVSVC